MKEYVEMWKHYADFKGMTTVRGYWMAFLINWLIGLVLGLLVSYVKSLGFLSSLYSLAILIPTISIFVRRMNDAGKSWANIFWGFLPVVGWIIQIVKLCAPSQAKAE